MKNKTPIKSTRNPPINTQSINRLKIFVTLYKFYYNLKWKNQIDSSSESNSENKLNGRRSKEEQRLFIRGCILFKNDWKLVEKYEKTRSLKWIQKHTEKYLLKLIKKYFESKEDYKKFDLDLRLT